MGNSSFVSHPVALPMRLSLFILQGIHYVSEYFQHFFTRIMEMVQEFYSYMVTEDKYNHVEKWPFEVPLTQKGKQTLPLNSACLKLMYQVFLSSQPVDSSDRQITEGRL